MLSPSFGSSSSRVSTICLKILRGRGFHDGDSFTFTIDVKFESTNL